LTFMPSPSSLQLSPPHTTRFNTDWVKGRISRRVSSIRPEARLLSLVSDDKTDEDGLLAGEFDGILGQREQPNQRLRIYN
jgi:hypothetical protein